MAKSVDSTIILARIGGAHGIKGEVRAQVFAEDPLAIGDYGPLFDVSGRRFEVAAVRPAKSAFILEFKGVSDRNAAEALNGVELFIGRDSLPYEVLEDDEFFQSDLIGLSVVDGEDRQYGAVLAVHDFGAGIVLELEQPDRHAVMIPFSEAAVPEIDVETGRLVVDPVAAGLVGDETQAHSRQSKGAGSRRRRPPKRKDTVS